MTVAAAPAKVYVSWWEEAPMWDLAEIDKTYEAGKANGLLLTWALFDKRLLLPMSQLPAAVMSESDERTTEDEIRAKAAAGWFPLLPGAGWEENEDGAPLYVPSRIGLLLGLERAGYGADELRLIAELEEWAIDNIFTVDDLAYVDDDVDALLLHVEARIEALGQGTSSESEADTLKKLESARSDLRFLTKLKADGVPDRLKPVIEKHAYRTRAFNDLTRVWLLDMDRGKIRAGYSPYVSCDSYRWSPVEGSSYGNINWRQTVRAALAYAEGGRISSEPVIRVPAFVLRGDLVTPAHTLRPAAYASEWKRFRIDTYLKVWAETRGERRCLNCSVVLPTGNDRKCFCSEKCRNAARQRRFRERNPRAVERAQKRYWDSIELGEEGG